MRNKKFILIFFLSVFSVPVVSWADLETAYFFANGNGRAWAIEEGSDKRPDIGIDEDGQAWVICNGSIYRANPEVLGEVMVAETTGMNPLFFAKSPQGQLYLLWKGDCGLKITTFSKGKIRELAYLQKSIEGRWSVFFCVDSAGRIWISGNFPVIYCWEDGQWKEYKLKQEMFLLNEYERERWPELLSRIIKSTEVSPGKIIFWGTDLDGLLVFSEDKIEHFRQIFSLPRIRFKEIKVVTDGVFWAVEGFNRKPQLFEVDMKKKKGTLLIPPNHPLRNQEILQIFPQEQGEGFVLCKTENDGKVSLWRIVKEGIKCEIESIGQTFVSCGGDPSSLLISKKGHLWLSAFHLGIWLKLKDADEWEHLDYSFGFPLPAVSNVKEDKDGNIWVSGYRSNGLVCLSSPVKAVKKWLNCAHSQNWKMVGRLREYVFDSDDCLWTILSRNPFILGRFAWSGWMALTPSKQPKYHNHILCRDNKGAVWLVDLRGREGGRGPIVFENKKDAYFSNMELACESLAKKGEIRNVYEDRYSSYGDIRNAICRIKNEKACFCSPALLHYFDGKGWKHWQIQDIDAISRGEFDRASNQPFFDAKSNLCVNISQRTWLWNGKRWNAVGFLEGTYEKTKRLNALRKEREEGLQEKLNRSGELGKITRVVEANDGTFWALTQFSLYKVVGDLWVEIDKGRHPLMGDQIDSIRIDKEGNLFVKAELNAYCRLADKQFPPETLIEEMLVVIKKIPFSISFSGKDDKTPAEKLRFSWSMDEGKWSSPSYDKTISFEHLANGEHVLKVKALDEELNYDSTPAVVRFTVKVDAKNLLAENLEMLKSSDYKEREKAVRNLVHIGREALSELKKLREESKDDDLHWWIDVVMQQIEQSVTSK
ncbi:MAG: WD40 repeat domain-containing protein [bacterium]|nr:WD40 repeat domain-containing protein [bacterium]